MHIGKFQCPCGEEFGDMDEQKALQRMNEFSNGENSDLTKVLVKAEIFTAREIFLRGYRAGHADGSADSTKRETPEPPRIA